MRLLPPPPPVQQAVQATPAARDRVIDAVRGVSLFVVVLGHAFMALVYWPYGEAPIIGNLLTTYPALQIASWFFQVMPLFFWAGGAANLISWRSSEKRGITSAQWTWDRARRLLRPVWPYLVVMALVGFLVALASPEQAEPLMALTTQLLWFLGVYLVITALTPALASLYRKNMWLPLFPLIAVSLISDAARLLWEFPPAVGLTNFISVWAAFSILGFWYVDGKLSKPLFLLPAALALTFFNIFLLREELYPVSMVGLPGQESNMTPPTLLLLSHGLALICLLCAAVPILKRILNYQKVWVRVVSINLVAMTVYLWHLPALMAATALLHFIGWQRPVDLDISGNPTPSYPLDVFWGLSIPLYALFAFLLWFFVRLAWPLEHQPLPWWDSQPHKDPPQYSGWLSPIAISISGFALLGLAAVGLAGFPTRTLNWAGIPLNAAILILTVLAGCLIARWCAGRRQTN